MVYKVVLRSTTSEELCRLHVSLTNAVEDRSLSVLITAIDITTVTYQQIDNFVIALPRSVKQRNLLKVVFFVRIAAKVNENLHHLK